MNEFDRQILLFTKKIDNPDITFVSHSHVKLTDQKNNDVIFYFLNAENQVLKVDIQDRSEVLTTPIKIEDILRPFHQRNCHVNAELFKGQKEPYPCDCGLQDAIGVIKEQYKPL